MTAAHEPKRRGRPRRVVPVTELELLTVPQAVLYLAVKGFPRSRAKVKAAIVAGRIQPVYVDWEHLDRLRQPLYKMPPEALDRWISASLQLLKIMPLSA
jgi:hypothetical protein